LFLNNFTRETITKTILRANAANFLQICANLQKYWNNAMSNDGSSIEDNRSVSWRLSCIYNKFYIYLLRYFKIEMIN
jgi:hypothetical protein